MMYGSYGYTGGYTDESIIRSGPPCGTTPGLVDKVRWGFDEATSAFAWTTMFSLGILPFILYPLAGKVVMKNASYRKRLLVTNAVVLAYYAGMKYRSAQESWERACERQGMIK